MVLRTAALPEIRYRLEAGNRPPEPCEGEPAGSVILVRRSEYGSGAAAFVATSRRPWMAFLQRRGADPYSSGRTSYAQPTIRTGLNVIALRVNEQVVTNPSVRCGSLNE